MAKTIKRLGKTTSRLRVKSISPKNYGKFYNIGQFEALELVTDDEDNSPMIRVYNASRRCNYYVSAETYRTILSRVHFVTVGR